MFAIYQDGNRVMVTDSYEEACEYLDNVFDSDCWFKIEAGYEVKEEN